MDNKLFVGNLAWASTEDDIRAHFAQFGEVTSVEVMRDKFTGRARGFAFVTMANGEAALAAIAKTEGVDFMGRPLKVNVARPREERPSFGGGGDRGGFGGERRSGGFGGGRGGFGFDWNPVAGDYSVDVIVTGEQWGTRWNYAISCPRGSRR